MITAATAALTGLLAIVLWQTFSVVVRDDRETAREARLRRHA